MKYLLIILLPNKPEQKIALEEDRITLGRSSGNSIQLSVPEISSRHLEFNKTPGGYRVLDVGSTNGTKVNGTRIREHDLEDGDRLLIGQVLRVEYRVLADEAPTAQEAAPPKPKVVEAKPEPAVPTVLMEKAPPAIPTAKTVPAVSVSPVVPRKPPPANPRIPRPAKPSQGPPPANPASPKKPPSAPPTGPNSPTVRKLKPPKPGER